MHSRYISKVDFIPFTKVFVLFTDVAVSFIGIECKYSS